MNGSLVFPLLAAAGVALVVQNLLMVKITQSVSTVVITLVINAAVGLSLLLSTLLARKGLPGVGEPLQALRPWTLLPGVLGSFFVFAGIVGYQQAGPVATVTILVASQLLTGLLVSALQTRTLPGILSLAGAALLVAGAAMLLKGRG